MQKIMKKKLVILGSSGSIGKSALEVVEKNRERIDVVALSVHSSLDALQDQISRFCPQRVAITKKEAHEKFQKSFYAGSVHLADFEDGIAELINETDCDCVLNAVVGAAGLKASLETVRSGKRLALANKESMVAGGELINAEAAKTGAEIIPVDSEHSAIWQSLFSGDKKEIKRILLTGSGGPFREWPLEKFKSITKKQALNHPTWNMGPKITIDSATMMNKGLEIIEAARLYNISAEKIRVVIHPQSIVHSMVEFIDSSIIAQISAPDMKLPIAYAVFYPERVEGDFGYIDLAEAGTLTFAEPDFEKFPLLKLAWNVTERGGTVPAVYNAANEVAVEAFLKETIDFMQIPDIVIEAVEKHQTVENPSLDDILEADRWARKEATKAGGVKL